jgi:hypothetical protein
MAIRDHVHGERNSPKLLVDGSIEQLFAGGRIGQNDKEIEIARRLRIATRT